MIFRKKHSSPAHRWELFSCGWRGHETYEPVGGTEAKKFAKHLHMQTKQGEAWRCLRCGNYILGRPKHSGPIDKAPLVLRGKVLREALILRFLGAERFIRGLILLLLGYGIIRFKQNEGSLAKVFQDSLPAIRDLAKNFNYDIDHSETMHVIQSALNASQNKLTLVAVAIFVYAAIQLTEGIGLWLMKRWGEYFAVVATSFFIPIEIYEVFHHATVLKFGALALNIAAVIYLIYSKRLFGVRGGGAAHHADLHAERILELSDSSSG